MLTIFCGEDSAAARTQFTQVVDKHKAAQAEILNIAPSAVIEIYKGVADNLSLFSTQKVFCVENLEKYSFKKSTKAKKDAMYEALVAISGDKSITLLDFEDGKQSRQLKLKDLAKVVESKPATSIFQLLEECYPPNKAQFIGSLRTVCETQDEMFTFIMLARHIRLLTVIAHGVVPDKLPPWQKYKIIAQSKKWNKESLTNFYSGIIKIEINAKTSSDPYGVAKSLEILACHYL